MGTRSAVDEPCLFLADFCPTNLRGGIFRHMIELKMLRRIGPPLVAVVVGVMTGFYVWQPAFEDLKRFFNKLLWMLTLYRKNQGKRIESKNDLEPLSPTTTLGIPVDHRDKENE